MIWTLEQRREACFRAPMGRELVRPDSVIIERPDWYQVITPSAPGTVLNEVVFSQLEAEDADRMICETVAHYEAAQTRTLA